MRKKKEIKKVLIDIPQEVVSYKLLQEIAAHAGFKTAVTGKGKVKPFIESLIVKESLAYVIINNQKIKHATTAKKH